MNMGIGNNYQYEIEHLATSGGSKINSLMRKLYLNCTEAVPEERIEFVIVLNKQIFNKTDSGQQYQKWTPRLLNRRLQDQKV